MLLKSAYRAKFMRKLKLYQSFKEDFKKHCFLGEGDIEKPRFE